MRRRRLVGWLVSAVLTVALGVVGAAGARGNAPVTVLAGLTTASFVFTSATSDVATVNLAAPATPATPVLPPLALTDAAHYSRISLARYFGREYTKRSQLSEAVRGCRKITPSRASCSVEWYFGNYTFAGHTMIWLSRDAKGVLWNYAFNISKTDDACAHLGKPASVCTRTFVVR